MKSTRQFASAEQIICGWHSRKHCIVVLLHCVVTPLSLSPKIQLPLPNHRRGNAWELHPTVDHAREKICWQVGWLAQPTFLFETKTNSPGGGTHRHQVRGAGVADLRHGTPPQRLRQGVQVPAPDADRWGRGLPGGWSHPCGTHGICAHHSLRNIWLAQLMENMVGGGHP